MSTIADLWKILAIASSLKCKVYHDLISNLQRESVYRVRQSCGYKFEFERQHGSRWVLQPVNNMSVNIELYHRSTTEVFGIGKNQQEILSVC